jgi:hypothetical protein
MLDLAAELLPRFRWELKRGVVVVKLAMDFAMMEIAAVQKSMLKITNWNSYCGSGPAFCEESSASGVQFFPQKRVNMNVCNSCGYSLAFFDSMGM